MNRLFIFLGLTTSLLSAVVHAEKIRNEPINIYGDDRGKSERTSIADRKGDRDRDPPTSHHKPESKPSPSAPPASPSISYPNSEQITVPPEVAAGLYFDYSVYQKMKGYRYSFNNGVHTIQSLIPIDVFGEIVDGIATKKSNGLNYLDRLAIRDFQTDLQKRPDFAQAEKKRQEINNLIKKEEQQSNERSQKYLSEFRRQVANPVGLEKRAVDAKNALFQTPILYDINSPQIAEEVFTQRLYGLSHSLLALKVLNQYSAENVIHGPNAQKVAEVLIEVAESAALFIKGTGVGGLEVGVETVKGVKQIVAFGTDSLAHPYQAIEKITKTLEIINPQMMKDFVSFELERISRTLKYGNAYERGQLLGAVLGNLALTFLPGEMATYAGRIAPTLKETTLFEHLNELTKSFQKIADADVELGKIHALFASDLSLERTREAIQKCFDLGLKSKEELERMALLVHYTLKNEVGAVGDIEALVQEFSLYFKSWPKGAEVLEVLSADAENAKVIIAGDELPYLAGSKIVKIRLIQETKFLRFHHSENKVSAWIVNAEEVKGMNAQQIKQYLNLPQQPTHVSEITLKSGEELEISKIGKNKFGSKDGGTQFKIKRELSEKEFVNTRTIL